jgi:hypothetical protein
MSIGSSSTSTCLSLDSTDTALCTPLLLETEEDAQAHAITAFFNLPTRILIGTKKLDFPVSPVHMLYNCSLWQKAVEGGDEPKALLTETCVEPTDVEFQRAWMRANGFDDGKGPLGESGERYLDYLGYKTPTPSKISGDIRRAMSTVAKTYEERKSSFNGEEQALKIIRLYTQHIQSSTVPTWSINIDLKSGAKTILENLGFSVTRGVGIAYQVQWIPPQRKPASKRPRSE